MMVDQNWGYFHAPAPKEPSQDKPELVLLHSTSTIWAPTAREGRRRFLLLAHQQQADVVIDAVDWLKEVRARVQGNEVCRKYRVWWHKRRRGRRPFSGPLKAPA